MTIEALVARVNQWSAHHGYHPVSVRQVRDWVDEGLVPNAQPHGRRRGESPDWHRNARHYRRILQIVWLKGHGVRYTDHLAVRLWLWGADLPPDRVRASLIAVYDRTRRQVAREMRTTWYPPTDPHPSQQRALDRHLRPLAQQLPLGLSAEVILGNPGPWLGPLMHGQSSGGQMRVLGSALDDVGVPVEELKPANGFPGINLTFLSGLLANPEEVEQTPSETFATASPVLLRNAREAAWRFRRSLPLFASLMTSAFSVPEDWDDPTGGNKRTTPDYLIVDFIFWVQNGLVNGDEGERLAQFLRRVGHPATRLTNYIKNVPAVRQRFERLNTALGAHTLSAIPAVAQGAAQRVPGARRSFRAMWHDLAPHGLRTFLAARKCPEVQELLAKVFTDQ